MTSRHKSAQRRRRTSRSSPAHRLNRPPGPINTKSIMASPFRVERFVTLAALASMSSDDPLAKAKANSNDKGAEQQLVCVTGAGGFIGSWVVKELLRRGYRVRGTARDPADCKNAHLLALEGAKERLTLCRADVLDRDSLRAAFADCHGVFHVASPVSNDPELVPVAVEGTRNVVNAAADMGARCLVFTSSYGAVHMDPNRSPDAVLDETCWSDYDYCKRTQNTYCCAKMLAERTATAEAARRGLRLAVVVPSVTTGPALQRALNVSTHHVARYLTGARDTYPNAVAAYADVRDVARAHVLAYERPAARGRYLCIAAVLHRAELAAVLRDLFPQYPVTARCEDDGGKPMARPYRFSCRRAKEELGLEFTPLRKSLYDAVLCMQSRGHLLPAIQQQRRHHQRASL